VITISTQEASDTFVSVFHRVRRAVDAEMSAAGLSLARTKLLSHLASAPVRQSVLAGLLEVAARTVTEMVDGLERDGLAERQDDPTDRRAKLVGLTAAGRTALERSLLVRDRIRDEIFSALDPDSLAIFTDLLRALDASPALTPARSSS
jgi:DNA-binding MarR family transcriptional regulator